MPEIHYFLWPLRALNVIDTDLPATEGALPQVLSTLWDRIAETATQPEAEARIALIDTGVSRRHPNLASRVIAEECLDLVAHPQGAAYDPGLSAAQKRWFFEGLDLSGLGGLDLGIEDRDWLEDLATTLRQTPGVVHPLIDPDELFGAHGTACAGLMVAEPAASAPGRTGPAATQLRGAAPNPDPAVVPLFGVDPFSRLFSIRTGFGDDPEQVIAAFLHAWARGADVIVLPRGLPDPLHGPLPLADHLRAGLEAQGAETRLDLFARLGTDAPGPAPHGPDPHSAEPSPARARAWRVARAVILAVSREVPVICAAGNEGLSQPIYPANLAAEDNGIIAVGAITALGMRAGYSNYGALTVVGPSDDAPVFNRHQFRQPIERARSPALPEGSGRGDLALAPLPGQCTVPLSDLSLVTTDLPGPFGYDDGTRRGLYTEFGGTSGAASLIGGVAALMQRARKAHGQTPLKGPVLKAVLTATSFLNRPVVAVLPRPPEPTETGETATGDFGTPCCDPMNRTDEQHEDLSHFLGAGLPDADLAVASALAL